MSNNVRIKEIGAQNDITLITIRGSLDTVVAYHLQEQVEALIENGCYKYLIDLKELKHISSAGVGLFSAVILDLQRHNGEIIFVNIPDQVHQVLKITRLIEILTLAESMEEALAILEAVEEPE